MKKTMAPLNELEDGPQIMMLKKEEGKIGIKRTKENVKGYIDVVKHLPLVWFMAISIGVVEFLVFEYIERRHLPKYFNDIFVIVSGIFLNYTVTKKIHWKRVIWVLGAYVFFLRNPLKIFFPEINYFLENNLYSFMAGLIIWVLYFTDMYLADLLGAINCDYYIDLETKTVHLIKGMVIYKKEIIIDFEQIKHIIIIAICIPKEGDDALEPLFQKTIVYANIVTPAMKAKFSFRYQIDLIDKDLNAYNIYDGVELHEIKKTANCLGRKMNVKVIDKTKILT
jgi:hypothetical protein